MSGSLSEVFESGARRNPAAPAFISGERIVSHRELLACVNVAARQFRESGMGDGSVVALSLDQRPLHCVAMLALARLGAVFFPLRPGLPQTERRRLIDLYGASFVIGGSRATRDEGPHFIEFEQLAVRGDERGFDFAGPQPRPDAPLRIGLTSGTTGLPKGILLTHGEFVERMVNTLPECGPRTRLLPPNLNLTVASLLALRVLCSGGALVFPRSYEFPALAAAINLHGVTHMLMSPAAAGQLVASLPDDGPSFTSLEHLRLVGARPSRRLLDQLRARCTPNLFVPYALSELGVITMAGPEELAREPAAAGARCPWAAVEIVDPEGCALPPGQTGEIVIRTWPMPQHYHRDAAATASAFRDSWFRSGDFGHVSAEGRLYVEGRVDDIINAGGHKIVPGRIEDVLLEHPSVREAAAFGFEAGGEQVLLAAVVPEAGGPSAELFEHCQRRLGALAPRRIVVMRQLPRNDSGKVLLGELRRRVAGALSGSGNELVSV